MTRRALKLAICVTIGVLLSAGAALMCALDGPGDQRTQFVYKNMVLARSLPDGIAFPRLPHQWINVTQHSAVGCTYVLVYCHDDRITSGAIPIPSEDARFRNTIYCDARWPLRCLHGAVRPVTWPRLGGRWDFWHPGAWLPRTKAPLAEVGILWTGAAADVFFFGAAAWGTGAACMWAFGRRRFRRGLCLACAYDRSGLGTDAPCPECGKTA